MGATCWGLRSNYEMGIDIEKNKPEINKLKQIEKFNWNEGNSYGCTVEEIVMLSLSNDYGDWINPQTSHILFSEFKKLMFLNHMHLSELKAENLLEGKALHKKQADKKAYLGLVAPPLLDTIWCTLIKMKIYEKFCTLFFDGFLDRSLPNLKSDEKYDYKVTLGLLTKYGQMLTPLWSVWPNYSKENHLEDHKWYVTVDPNDLSRIVGSVKTKSKTGSTSVEEWKKICTEVSTEHATGNSSKEEKVAAFSANKIKFDNKEKTVKSIFGEIEMRDSKSTATRQRLQEKYMINLDTAKWWLKEYYKFIIMLIMDDSAYLPSWKVQAVLNTHAENSEAFRHFSFEVLGKLIYPEDYNSHITDTPELKKKYKNTLNEYKNLYGSTPNSNLWESADSKFTCVDRDDEGSEEEKLSSENDKSRAITVSILRLVAVNQLVEAKYNPFDTTKLTDPSKTEFESQITDTIKNQKERESEAKKSNLYYWRVSYPHCSNVYSGLQLSLKGVEYFPNFNQDSKEKQNIFNKGGLAFLIDPFSESSLKSENYVDTLLKKFYDGAKQELSNSLTIDDIADSAFRNKYLQSSQKLVLKNKGED